MPAQSRDDQEQNLLAQLYRKLQSKETKSPVLLKRLIGLLAHIHDTPTKPKVRGAKQRDRKRAAASLIHRLREEKNGATFIFQQNRGRGARPSSNSISSILAWLTWGTHAT